MTDAGWSPDAADFGVLLDDSSLEPALAKIRADQSRYQAAHPAEMAEIRHMRTSTPRSLR